MRSEYWAIVPVDPALLCINYENYHCHRRQDCVWDEIPAMQKIETLLLGGAA